MAIRWSFQRTPSQLARPQHLLHGPPTANERFGIDISPISTGFPR